MRPRPLTGAAAALVAFPLLGVVGCGTPSACAGQCSPPYSSVVLFRAGTTVPEARAAVGRCAHVPGVLRTQVTATASGGPGGQVWTLAPHPSRVISCLRRSPAITGLASPG
jgi:hypothetical protein